MDENKLDYIYIYIYIYTRIYILYIYNLYIYIYTRLYTRLCLVKAMVFPVVMYHVGVLL